MIQKLFNKLEPKTSVAKEHMLFSNKQLVNLILPLFVDQILLLVVTFLSSLMIAQAGANALSGVSLVDMINTFMFFVFIALASGGSVVISQYIGSKNNSMAEHSAAQLFSFNIVISLVVTVFLVLFRGPIINALFGQADAEVISTASLYFYLSVFSYPFYSIYQSGNAVFRSIGNTKIPMISSILMNFLTFFGNALSIYVFHAGVYGFGISAISARLIASLLVFILALRGSKVFNIQIKHIFEYHKEIIQKIIAVAIPSSIENGVLAFGRLLLASLLAGFGTTHIAANGVVNSVVPIAVSFGLATNLVLVTVIGQVVGANDYEQARYYMKKLLLWTYVIDTLILVVHTLAVPFILNLYNLSGVISTIAFQLIILHNVSAQLIWPAAMSVPNALRATGDSKYTMKVSIVVMIVFRMGTAYILSLYFGLGVYGIWIAMVVDWLARVIFNLWRYKSNKWTQFRLI